MSPPPPASPPRHRRQLRNYLLDRRFQLKYAGLLAMTAAVLSLALGALLWQTSRTLVQQSRTAVAEGQRAVELGRKAMDERRKVTEVVRMNIVKDPVYGDSPELLAAFKADARKEDRQMAAEQAELERQAAALRAQAARLEVQQRTVLWALSGILLALVVALGLVGIVVTHRVAGPVFKMTRQLRRVGGGDLSEPAPLRKGDELRHFFAAFADMVGALRRRHQEHADRLGEALEALGEDAPEAVRRPLSEVRNELLRSLEGEG